MKRMLTYVFLSLATASLWAAAEAHDNKWNPDTILLEPVCRATDWNQNGALNDYVGLGKGYVCGCDPLAWGQVFTYHALNNGFPAKDWVPTPVTKLVFLDNVQTERTTKPGPYDWEKIREKEQEKDSDGREVSEVGRLMWDLGVLGGTSYWPGDAAGTVWPRGNNYFGYKCKQWLFSPPRPGGVLQPYWREMLRRIVRTTLQTGCPMVLQINNPMHMIVLDGWGVGKDGTEWFHVDKGWGSGSGTWWNLEKMEAELVACYPLTHPNDLGSVVVGRVTDTQGKAISGATVTLIAWRDGRKRTATSDANGLYAFTGLPRVDTAPLVHPDAYPTEGYTVTVEAKEYLVAERTVTVQGFVDESLANAKGDAWKGDAIGGESVIFPLNYGGAVADVALARQGERPVRYVSPDGMGSGTSWANAAPLMDEFPEDFAGSEIRAAKGVYSLSFELYLNNTITLKGGYDPLTDLRDPLGTPSVLRANDENQNYIVSVTSGSVLDGFRLEASAAASSLVAYVSGHGQTVSTVRNCVFAQGGPAKLAQGVGVETSLLLEGGKTLDRATLLHCSGIGAWPKGSDTDLGGNRFNLTPATLRPRMETPCTAGSAGHVCPAVGLDGRPLGGTAGALAPDLFGISSPGYHLRLR